MKHNPNRTAPRKSKKKRPGKTFGKNKRVSSWTGCPDQKIRGARSKKRAARKRHKRMEKLHAAKA